MNDKLEQLHAIVEKRIPDDVAVLLGIVETLVDLERRQDVIVEKLYQISNELTQHIEEPAAKPAVVPSTQTLLTMISDFKLRLEKLESERKTQVEKMVERVRAEEAAPVKVDPNVTRWTGKYDKSGKKLYKKAPRGIYCRNCAKTLSVEKKQALFCSRRCAKVWRDQHPGMLAQPRFAIEENKFTAKVVAGEGVEALA